MKRFMTVVLGLLFAVSMGGMAIAGSIEPSGPPTGGSGMYTLQNLYDYLTSGTALTVQTSFQEPTSGPGSTMKTTKQIGDAIKTLLDQSDVVPDNVESSKRFFCTQAGSWGIQTGTLAALPRPTATPTMTPTPTITPYGVYASCKAIKTATPGAGSGSYTIDPDGAGGNAPFNVYCDMTTDGGGWTLAGFKGSSVSNGDTFKSHGTIVTNFGEDQSTEDWSLDICNDKINAGANYSELAITSGMTASHCIRDFTYQWFFRFDGTYQGIVADWTTAIEAGTYSYKCSLSNAYAESSGWDATATRWMPLPVGGLESSGLHITAAGVYVSMTACGGQDYGWGHAGYFWVR